MSRRLTLLLALAICCSGCAVFDRGADGSWVLTQASVGGRTVEPVEGHPVTLTIERGAVSGSGGCNDYAIEADVVGGRFTAFEARDITEQVCDPAVMEVESVFWETLPSSLVYRVDGDRLELEGEGSLLEFSRAVSG